MGKAKTSNRQKGSSKKVHKSPTLRIKKGANIDLYDPIEAILDEEKIGRAIWECLKEGDSEGVIEVIQIHLEAVNKTRVAKEAHLSKTTMYHALRRKNPTIKTLAKLIHACV